MYDQLFKPFKFKRKHWNMSHVLILSYNLLLLLLKRMSQQLTSTYINIWKDGFLNLGRCSGERVSKRVRGICLLCGWAIPHYSKHRQSSADPFPAFPWLLCPLSVAGFLKDENCSCLQMTDWVTTYKRSTFWFKCVKKIHSSGFVSFT